MWLVPSCFVHWRKISPIPVVGIFCPSAIKASVICLKLIVLNKFLLLHMCDVAPDMPDMINVHTICHKTRIRCRIFFQFFLRHIFLQCFGHVIGVLLFPLDVFSAFFLYVIWLSAEKTGKRWLWFDFSLSHL